LTRETASAEARTSIESASAEVLSAEDELQELRRRLADLDQEIASGQQRETEVQAQADREADRIHYHEERLRELKEGNARALAEITQAGERQNVAREQLHHTHT